MLADKGEELGEAATSTANELKKPQNAALGVLALLGIGTTIAYPHESFQFFGFVGLQLTAIVAFLSYDKPEDAMAALTQSSRSFADRVGTAASSASSAGSKMKAPAAAASTTVAEAASKATKKEESAAKKGESALERALKAAVAKDSKPEPKPAVKTMFVNASADKPVPAMPASSKPSPSKEQKAPVVPPAAKSKPSEQKEDKSSKKGEKKKWPASIQAAATEAALLHRTSPSLLWRSLTSLVMAARMATPRGRGV